MSRVRSRGARACVERVGDFDGFGSKLVPLGGRETWLEDGREPVAESGFVGDELPESEVLLRRWVEMGIRDLACGVPGLAADAG